MWLLLCLFPVTKMVPSVQILNFKQSRMETCWMCSAVEICVKENFAMCSSVNHKCSQHSQPMCPSVNEYIGMCSTVNNVHWTYLWTSTLDFAQLWTSAMCVDCSCLIVGKPLDERPPVKEHIILSPPQKCDFWWKKVLWSTKYWIVSTKEWFFTWSETCQGGQGWGRWCR